MRAKLEILAWNAGCEQTSPDRSFAASRSSHATIFHLNVPLKAHFAAAFQRGPTGFDENIAVVKLDIHFNPRHGCRSCVSQVLKWDLLARFSWFATKTPNRSRARDKQFAAEETGFSSQGLGARNQLRNQSFGRAPYSSVSRASNGARERKRVR